MNGGTCRTSCSLCIFSFSWTLVQVLDPGFWGCSQSVFQGTDSLNCSQIPLEPPACFPDMAAVPDSPNPFSSITSLSFFFVQADPSIHLLVTNGGQNSLMESIHHGVPLVGIPLFTDQPGNPLWVEAKNMGVSILIEQLKAETLALKIKQVMGDKRYVCSPRGSTRGTGWKVLSPSPPKRLKLSLTKIPADLFLLNTKLKKWVLYFNKTNLR